MRLSLGTECAMIRSEAPYLKETGQAPLAPDLSFKLHRDLFCVLLLPWWQLIDSDSDVLWILFIYCCYLTVSELFCCAAQSVQSFILQNEKFLLTPTTTPRRLVMHQKPGPALASNNLTSFLHRSSSHRVTHWHLRRGYDKYGTFSCTFPAISTLLP